MHIKVLGRVSLCAGASVRVSARAPYLCLAVHNILWTSSRGCASCSCLPHRDPQPLLRCTPLRDPRPRLPFPAEQLDGRLRSSSSSRACIRASPMCDMWYRAYVRKRVYVRGCTARRLAGRALQELVAPNVTSGILRCI